MSAMFQPAELSDAFLCDMFEAFHMDPTSVGAQNAATRSDPFQLAVRRDKVNHHQHVFNVKTDEFKPLTNQKESGRCWLFACLNAMRIPFIREHNLQEFEFSQSYLFFWDKIERANYFLNTVVQIYHREPRETVGGRLFDFLLQEPINDAGQWDMVVNLVNKYGVMPKSHFRESFSSEESEKMNSILRSKLREFACALHAKLSADGQGRDANDREKELRDLLEEQMQTIYKIVGICLGVPGRTFEFEYYDKAKGYHTIGPMTPLQFYDRHVRSLFDVDSKVCLVADPRPVHPVGRLYSVDCLGNVVGRRRVVYNNQPVDVLVEAAAASIRSGEPVWFGSEVGKLFAETEGILDTQTVNFSSVVSTHAFLWGSKADRMRYGDSQMTHAMVITGAKEEGGQVTKWRVENSYGPNVHHGGYLLMTTDWFREFVFEVVVDKKFCPNDVLSVFEEETPTVLPAWDPMGALA